MTDTKNTTYQVITQQDTNGDLLLPEPPVLLKALGWTEGDDIRFDLDDEGKFVLSKTSKS